MDWKAYRANLNMEEPGKKHMANTLRKASLKVYKDLGPAAHKVLSEQELHDQINKTES